MKKLIAMILILALLIPSVVTGEQFAMDNHPDKFVGCWASFIPYSSTHYGDQTIVIALNSDGTFAIMLSFNDASNKVVDVTSFTGTWTEYKNYIIYQRDGKDTYGRWEIKNDMLWFTLEGASFGLKKIPTIEITQVIYPVMSDIDGEGEETTP